LSSLGDWMKRKTARIGSVMLGDGMPAICIPVLGATIEAIAQSAARAKAAQADLLELRMDSLSAMPTAQEAIAACNAAKESAPELPVLFTLRTKRDGGAGSEAPEAYEALLGAMIDSGACDAVDCELSVGAEAFSRISAKARAAGVTMVGSSHEFGEIGDMQRAASWLLAQQELGADICKAAVMTKDSVEALEAALVFARVKEQLNIPMIGIAMGPAGVITRICGVCIGSCLTFGTAGEASAPGQIEAKRLRAALETVQSAIG